MNDLRIDYAPLRDAAEQRTGGGGRPRRVFRVVVVLAVLAVLPFIVLIRGGVFAYSAWGVGTWPALILAALTTAFLLGAYAWLVGHRLGAGQGLQRIFTRGAMGVGVAYVIYTLIFVASANVKSEEVRAEYRSMHPLLRVASSALVLVDPASVITDAGRTPEDYRLMGLPPNEASLHFEQDDGFVHALDLRTSGRGELRNRAVELAFWALGFHSLRHVGTADHLHVSLRLPR